MNKVFYFLPLLLTLLFGCSNKNPETDTAVQRHSLGGSTTVAPVIEGAIEKIHEESPLYHIVYEAQGTSAGIRGLFNKTFELAGASRELSASEQEQGAVAHVFALDGLVVIVNDDVFVTDISRKQLEAIFAGEITNWLELGGDNLSIEVINREEGSGTRGSFTELVMETKNFNENVLTVDSNGNMVTMVTEIPGAIGYCGFSFIDQTYNMGGRTLTIEGVSPTPQNVRNKSYRLAHNLYLISNGIPAPDGFSTFFLNWMLSEQGQKIVNQLGFISINE